MRPLRTGVRRDGDRAFTLVEVVLAVVIAVGLMITALFFYNQAADTRARLLEESERLAAIRQVLDRVTDDLRTAFELPGSGFSGTPDAMQFVKTAAPSRTPWVQRSSETLAVPVSTDLAVVRYETSRATVGTNVSVTGLIRTETADLAAWMRARSSTGVVSEVVSLNSTNDASSILTGAPTEATNAVTTVTNGTGVVTHSMDEPLTDLIRFVRFRYWDGSEWLEDWMWSWLPLGVEVTLGGEPLPDGQGPGTYPYEVFRRVVHVPGGVARLAVMEKP